MRKVAAGASLPVSLAFTELGLQRIAASILHRVGLAAPHLSIAGRWQDHALFQVLNPDQPPLT